MALIGAIIGDIIGSQYEFPSMRPDDLDWKHCELFTDECEFTDDTVMSIATKYALDNYKGNFARAYRKLGMMYPDCGYGDKFDNWLRHPALGAYGSYGNGSAMRVSYIGDLVQDAESVLKLAKLSASCTHDSDAGIMGACVVSSIIAMSNLHFMEKDVVELNLHFTKKEIVDILYHMDEFYYDISIPMSELRKTYYWNETCDGTVPAAIRCFLESTDYESCIRNCLSLPCDMDTMCCIAGGMAEAFYGTTGLDNESILQKYLDYFLYGCIKDIL